MKTFRFFLESDRYKSPIRHSRTPVDPRASCHENEDAMEAAEMATKMFSDLGEYEHESLAVKIYNAAHDQKGKTNYLVVD